MIVTILFYISFARDCSYVLLTVVCDCSREFVFFFYMFLRFHDSHIGPTKIKYMRRFEEFYVLFTF